MRPLCLVLLCAAIAAVLLTAVIFAGNWLGPRMVDREYDPRPPVTPRPTTEPSDAIESQRAEADAARHDAAVARVEWEELSGLLYEK